MVALGGFEDRGEDAVDDLNGGEGEVAGEFADPGLDLAAADSEPFSTWTCRSAPRRRAYRGARG
jgi:hypothetical protein